MPHVSLRSALLHFAVFSLSLGLGFAQQEPTVTTPAEASQDVTPMAQTPLYRVQVVGRSTRAVNYRHRATTSVDFQGTKLDPNSKGRRRLPAARGD